MLKTVVLVLFFCYSLFGDVKWYQNLEQAKQEAQNQDKRIYMLIVSDSCVWCRKFKNQTLKDKNILNKLDKRYILLVLDKSSTKIPKRFKTTPIPRHYFLTKDGKVVFPVVGYRDVKEFNIFLDDVEKRYKRVEI
jgi:thioredoxin-related protein